MDNAKIAHLQNTYGLIAQPMDAIRQTLQAYFTARELKSEGSDTEWDEDSHSESDGDATAEVINAAKTNQLSDSDAESLDEQIQIDRRIHVCQDGEAEHKTISDFFTVDANGDVDEISMMPQSMNRD